MRKTLFLGFILLFADSVYSQSKYRLAIDCIQISKIEYLLVVMNNSNEEILLPLKPIVQKANDTLFINRAFSYEHSSSNVFKYTINGIVFFTNSPLSNHLKPDTVTKESNDPIPNFAVPGELFKLGPGKKHTFLIANSSNNQPRKIALNVFVEKYIVKEEKRKLIRKTVVGEIIPTEIPKQ